MISNKRPSYEVFIIVVVVILTLLLGASLYAGRAKVQRSSMLLQELSMFRSAITLFKMNEKKNPADLSELASTTYEIDGTTRPYLDRIPGMKEGSPIDPFGSPYVYDSGSAWVRSTTPGYEKW